MGEQQDFEKEVLKRLTVIETKLEPFTDNCRDCQKIIGDQRTEIATLTASTRSAHHRLDSIKTDVGLLVTILGLVFTGLNFLLHK